MKRILLLVLAISCASYAANHQLKTFLVKKPNGEVVTVTAPDKYAWSIDAAGNTSDQAIFGAPTERHFFMNEGGKWVSVLVICKVTDAQKKEKEQAIAAQKKAD
jgi:hypothetical protein